MAHYAVELENVTPAYGWQGGPEGDTEVVALRTRHERRNAVGSRMRHRYTLPFQNIHRESYLAYLKAAHLAMRGRLHSFLVKDWLDFAAEAESLGAAPAGTAAVQLVKTYAFGPASFQRLITKPVAGAVVYQGGVAKAGALDTETGLFVPSTAWTEGAALTWSGEFRVPVRFDNDFLPFSIDNASGGQHIVNGAVDLVEVFGE